MTPPASLMAINVSTPSGNIENAQANSPLSTSLCQFRRAADAADKLDALIRARIFDAEDRTEHVLLQQGHIEQFRGVLRFQQLTAEREGMPSAGQIKAEFVFATGRRRTMTVNGKNRPENLQHLLRRPAVQILQHAVVGQDLHLIVRKNHREEPAAFTRTLARLIDPRCRRTAMMAVGDVQILESAQIAFR